MKSVCLIDDDSIYLMLVNRIISFNGLSNQVSEFPDGRDAFEGLRETHVKGLPLPDVVFLDVNMPIWDGWDFLEEFEKLELPRYPEIYIVTSSTHSMERDKALSYSIVKDCIIKPVNLEVLRKILVD